MTASLVDLPERDYHALDAVSASALRCLATLTPRHWTHRRAAAEQTDAMRLGSALHCAVLEPQHFAARWHCAPDCDRRTKDGKAAYAAAMDAAAKAGAQILPADDHDAALAMAGSIMAHPDCAMWLRLCPRREVTVLGTVEGLAAKARIDALSPAELEGDGFFVDIKTIGREATIRAVRGECEDRGYFLQLAWYRLLLREAGIPVGGCAVLWVESKAPYCARALPIDPRTLDLYEQEIAPALAAYRAWQADPNADWRDGDSELGASPWRRKGGV